MNKERLTFIGVELKAPTYQDSLDFFIFFIVSLIASLCLIRFELLSINDVKFILLGGLTGFVLDGFGFDPIKYPAQTILVGIVFYVIACYIVITF